MNELHFYEKMVGLPDLEITAVEESAMKLIFYGRFKKTKALCPVFLQPTGLINQTEVCKFRGLQISARQIWLHLRLTLAI